MKKYVCTEGIRTTSIRLPEGLWRLLKRWCLDHDTSMQAVIEDLVRDFLRRQPIRKEEGK